MKSEDILVLLKAGYTRQEIDAMDQAPADPAKADPPKDPAKADPPKDPDPKEQKAQKAPDPAPVTNDNNAILEAINQLGAKMTAAMQAASLGAAMMQAPAGDTLESVMAQIIQPTAPTK